MNQDCIAPVRASLPAVIPAIADPAIMTIPSGVCFGVEFNDANCYGLRYCDNEPRIASAAIYFLAHQTFQIFAFLYSTASQTGSQAF